MSKAEKYKQFGLWLMIQSIPLGFICFIAFYLLQSTRMQFEVAMPLGVAWGAIGAVIHYMSRKRGDKFRYWATGIFLVVTVGTSFGLAKGFAWDYSSLKPCPVCGFVALEKEGATCPVCHVAFTLEEAQKEDFANLDEYIQAAQTMYFMPSGQDTTINFDAPCNCRANFPKSKDWKPAVTRQYILEVKAMTKEAK
jgi:hypothetical protein